MKKTLFSTLLFSLALAGAGGGLVAGQPESAQEGSPTAVTGADLPYVYTKWKQYTVADGLPNDHIFAVKAVGPYIWVGTEGGLARLDKRTGKITSWTEEDGLPWRVVSAIDVDPKTGEVWLGMFGGGLARFSGGRFDHFHQLNSGLVNDVVYGVCVENDNIWAATTAGASRYNTLSGEWTIYTERNAPMEEIWNYGCTVGDGKVYLGVWGSGVLEFDIATERWKDYLDPDGEMEIDLYRDDGIVHVITTGVSHVESTLWVTTYFGASRYDGRHWRGYFKQDSGVPSDFHNAVKGRSADEAWFSTDKGLGVLTDFESDTWVTYTTDHETGTGRAVIQRGTEILDTVTMPPNLPHNYVLWSELDGDDWWVGTSKGLAHAVGEGYYPGLRRVERRPVVADDAGEGSDREIATLDTRAIVEEIDVGPYEVPDLPLKKSSNYASSAVDVEPYGHVTPYFEHFLEQMEYTGPARALPEPEELEAVKIGFLGPIKPTVSVATGGRSHEEPLGNAMLRGSRLAIEQANAAGGYLDREIPFELVVHNDNGLWGASGNEIIDMAYKKGVWAILGTIDGANSHIAIRVALKAEIPMVNTGDTDPTFIETNIPWVIRTIGDDRQQSYILLDYLFRKMGYERVAIMRASNRYGRFGVREIKDGSRRLGHPVIVEMAYPVGGEDFSLHLDRIEEAQPEVIVHWGDGEDGARILNQIRERGMTQPFFCSDRCVSDTFVEAAGENAVGVLAPYPWNPDRTDPKLVGFKSAFRERFGTEPDTYAAHAYDGMNMLIWAIQNAGLNRAKIRDLLAYRVEPWPGVTGDIPLNAVLDDAGEVFLARYEGERWRYYSREDLDIPSGLVVPEPRTERETAAVSAVDPARDFRATPLEYAGPEGEDPEVDELAEVVIGWFGPSDPAEPEQSDLWTAASLAIEEANAAGGYRGVPFKLEARWSENRWGSGVSQLSRLAYEQKISAILGSVDGPSAHLAEQVVAKARLPLVSPVSTDKSVNLAGVPWMFSLAPADHLWAPVLVDAILDRLAGLEGTGFALLSGTDHDSRLAATEILAELAARDQGPALHLEFRPGSESFSPQLELLAGEKPGVILIVGGAEDSARLTSALRAWDPTAAIYGTPQMARSLFVELAGPAAEEVRFPLLLDPENEIADREAFARRFYGRTGSEPDWAAITSYDATSLLVAAIRRAGPNRAGIREALIALSPWQGIGGLVEWDPVGQNLRPVTALGTVRSGRIVAHFLTGTTSSPHLAQVLLRSPTLPIQPQAGQRASK
jgi:ABC-type branched-subunit amino acid transport system substrate-binding protein